MPAASAVIFDLFGTLVPAYHHHAVLSEMARILEVPTDDFVRRFAEDTKEDRETGRFASLEENLGQICRAMAARCSEAQVSRAAEARREFTRAALRPRPEAAPTLRELRERGHRLGLISDCCEVVPPLWEESPLAPLLDVVVFSCRVGLRKPEPGIYQAACRGLAVEPSACCYVGDGGSDELTGAQRAAALAQSATFGSGLRPVPRFSERTPRRRIQSSMRP